MASLSLVPSSYAASSSLKFSVLSSIHSNFKLPSSSLNYRKEVRTISCSLLVHEAVFWSSIQPDVYCFLLCPSILIPLFVASSRRLLGRKILPLSDFSDSAVSIVREGLHSICGWQQINRGALHLLTLLVLANAFYSDVSAPDPSDTFENIPQDLSGGDKRKRIQKPKNRKAEGCTQKCVGTCIQGGAGSPGEGPFNVRRPLVVFKEGFRSRQYCLIECSEICNLIGDGDDGP